MKKKFNFTYAELAQRGDRVKSLMERDATELSEMGYDADFTTAYTTKLTRYKGLQPDVYWQGQQMFHTNQKTENRKLLEGLLSEFRFRSKLALNENSMEYKMFRFSRLAGMVEVDLISFTSHVVKTAEPMLDKLAVRKVDATTLEELLDAAEKLDQSLDAQKESKSLRIQKAMERMTIANELYGMIAEICEVGKRIWSGKNEASYDDYLLYGSNQSINEDESANEPEEELVNGIGDEPAT